LIHGVSRYTAAKEPTRAAGKFDGNVLLSFRSAVIFKIQEVLLSQTSW